MLKLKEYLDGVWSKYSPVIMSFSGPFKENIFNLFTELHHNYEFGKNPDRYGNKHSESLYRIVGELQKNSVVFDGGCGSGGDAICIAKKGYDVVAVDTSSKGLKIAKERMRGANVNTIFFKKITISDYLRVYGGKQFDLMYCFNSLQYDLKKYETIKSMQSHTNDGGYNIVSGPLFHTRTRYGFDLSIVKELYHDREIIEEEQYEQHEGKTGRLWFYFVFKKSLHNNSGTNTTQHL